MNISKWKTVSKFPMKRTSDSRIVKVEASKNKMDRVARSFKLFSILSDQEVLVDVGDHTSSGNGSLDKEIELFVTSDGQLQVSGGDSSHLEVLWGIACKLENFSSQILQNSSSVNGGGWTDSVLGWDSALQESVDSTDRELKTSSGWLGLGWLLRLANFTSFTTFTTFSSFSSFSSCHWINYSS